MIAVRQMSYHFASVCALAGDPAKQDADTIERKLFGGKLSLQVIDESSAIVDFILNAANWEDLFGDTLVCKFPYLI